MNNKTDHLLRERKLMFRMREYVLTRRNISLQKWFDSLPVKHGVKREPSRGGATGAGSGVSLSGLGNGNETARSGGGGNETARSDFSASKINEWEGALPDDSTPLAQHNSNDDELGNSGGSSSGSGVNGVNGVSEGVGNWDLLPLSNVPDVSSNVDIMVKLDEESVTLVGIEQESDDVMMSGLKPVVVESKEEEEEGKEEKEEGLSTTSSNEKEDTVQSSTSVKDKDDVEDDISINKDSNSNDDDNSIDTNESNIVKQNSSTSFYVNLSTTSGDHVLQEGGGGGNVGGEGISTGVDINNNNGVGGGEASSSTNKGVASWGSNLIKVEEHVERVGMTEFRKNLRKRMGKFAFNRRY